MKKNVIILQNIPVRDKPYTQAIDEDENYVKCYMPKESYCDVIKALKKQSLMPPVEEVDEKYPALGRCYFCQSCSVMFVGWEYPNGRTNYCGNCGQKLREVKD